MAALKTKKNKSSVTAFLNKIKHKQRREDCFKRLELIKTITKEEPVMWGTSIVGFGSYHYVYASGREGDWPVAGFSPRAQNISIYIMAGIDAFPDLMDQLGKYKTGVSCLYISKLEDIDLTILKRLIKASIQVIKKRYK